MHPYIAMCKSVKNDQSRILFIFPLFYFCKAPGVSFFVVIWFFHPIISLYRRIKTDAESITWIFPIVYKKRGEGMNVFSLIWFFHPRACLFYRMRDGESGFTYFLFLYWHTFTSTFNAYGIYFIIIIYYNNIILLFSFFYIVFINGIQVSSGCFTSRSPSLCSRMTPTKRFQKRIFHNNNQFKKEETETVTIRSYFWPVFYTKKKNGTRKWCFIYVYPPRVAFITSSGSGDVMIFLVSSFLLSLLYFILLLHLLFLLFLHFDVE